MDLESFHFPVLSYKKKTLKDLCLLYDTQYPVHFISFLYAV